MAKPDESSGLSSQPSLPSPQPDVLSAGVRTAGSGGASAAPNACIVTPDPTNPWNWPQGPGLPGIPALPDDAWAPGLPGIPGPGLPRPARWPGLPGAPAAPQDQVVSHAELERLVKEVQRRVQGQGPATAGNALNNSPPLGGGPKGGGSGLTPQQQQLKQALTSVLMTESGRKPGPNFSKMSAAVRAVLALAARPVVVGSAVAPSSGLRSSEGAQPVTHIVGVLDRSTSMWKVRDLTMRAFNAHQEKVREWAPVVGTTKLTRILFSDEVTVDAEAKDPGESLDLTAEDYVPSGNTALLDAIGRAIEVMLEQPDIHSPQAAVFINIYTDGRDNHSSIYTEDVLRTLLHVLQATGRWTIALDGPKGPAQALAQRIGIPAGNVHLFDVENAEERQTSLEHFAATSASFMAARSAGAMASVNLQACAESLLDASKKGSPRG